MGVIFAAAAAFTPFLDSIFRLEPAGEAEYYKRVFLIFAIGNGLVFPVGIFSEVVIGLKRVPYLMQIGEHLPQRVTRAVPWLFR